MPSKTDQPKYRHYRPKNLAVVRINGRDVYLGRYNSPESWEKYGRVLAEWRSSGIVATPAKPSGSIGGLLVSELITIYVAHADRYYRRTDGEPTGESDNIRLALTPANELYGGTPANDFGPKALKAVRQSMIDSGLCRRTINQRVARIVRMFRYGVENELLPATIHHALKAVCSLKKGRSGAKESRAVKPVPDAQVEAARPFLSRQLWAVVEIQRLTGMRSGEVLRMRTADLNVAGPVWEYIPERHKTEHHEKARRIFIGPRAQEILRPWLRAELAEYLFQPREAEAERLAERNRKRKTPLTPSQRARKRQPKPEKSPGNRYDSRAYAHAVARACDRAFPHPVLSAINQKKLTAEQREELNAWRRAHRWHPHQLRHRAATELRKLCGLEAARVILGHSSPAVTETYAEIDVQKAVSAMNKYG